jgi:hypothetical protein
LDDDGVQVNEFDYAVLTVPPGRRAWLDDDDVETLEAAVWQAAFMFEVMAVVESTHHATRPASWGGLTFRSRTERRIAQALDRAGVAFMNNARGRWGTPEGRHVREPDFVVMTAGKLGVLEVDSPTDHAGRAADDHARDRLFRQHGVKVVERYDARRCHDEPEQVVQEFLDLLMLNG